MRTLLVFPKIDGGFLSLGLNKELYPGIRFEYPLGNSALVTVRTAIGALPEPAFSCLMSSLEPAGLGVNDSFFGRLIKKNRRPKTVSKSPIAKIKKNAISIEARIVF